MTYSVANLQDLQSLGLIIGVVTIEVIGICQWTKNFIKKKKGRFYAVLSSLFLIPCVWVHSSMVDPTVTFLFDLYFIPMAVIQMAYEVIVQAFPQAIRGLVDRMVGVSRDKLEDPRGFM